MNFIILHSFSFSLESFSVGLSLARVLILAVNQTEKQKKKAGDTRIEAKFAVQIESLPGESGFVSVSFLVFRLRRSPIQFSKGKLPVFLKTVAFWLYKDGWTKFISVYYVFIIL